MDKPESLAFGLRRVGRKMESDMDKPVGNMTDEELDAEIVRREKIRGQKRREALGPKWTDLAQEVNEFFAGKRGKYSLQLKLNLFIALVTEEDMV